MSQHDFTIDNQGFPAFRSDLNNALQALASVSAGATAPSTTFAYQLWYDTTADILKIRNADDDAWITLFTFDQATDSVQVSGEELVDDTTPALGGDLDTNGNDINFGDNDKAQFGAGNDLQIYHDSATGDSNIDEIGSGNLVLNVNGFVVEKYGAANEKMLEGIADGAVNLYHNGLTKLATTNTGVDVTGTVTADGLTIDTVGAIGIAGGVRPYFSRSSVGGISIGGADVFPATTTGSANDDTLDLGSASARWDDVYATNGTIQTSDENEKQQIASLTSAEITAAKAISKLFKTFKWNSSVTENGDNARTHTGVIAQQVETAMTDAGLDAGDYAFFISTDWYVDADGNEVEADAVGAIAKNRKGIRYPELLSFIGAATEQRLTDIESRLDLLEAN